ncbi:MAG TPA: type II toxin-antitoxin system VapC family toxin [Thermodesulfobacteriota bacterium]|nr:type II toxin-antitoxin system VapC family toxin [Thermodesulfobacteriota bacterium]
MKPPAKGYVLDTNVILRYLLSDDPEQSPRSEALMEKLESGKEGAELPPVVITELVWTLNKFYKVPRSEISEKLTRILGFRGVVSPEKKLVSEALALYNQSRADFVDCFLAAKSRREGITVYSFDKDDFNKLGCQWKEP